MDRFAGQSVLVTGASSGIGKATAMRLAQEGARVALVARTEVALRSAAKELPGEGHVICACDLTEASGRGVLLEFLKAQAIKLGGLAHCAGIHWLRPYKLLNEAALDEMLRSHVGSSLLLTREVVFGRVTAAEGFSAVWVSSVAALRGEAAAVAYSAAKGALIAAARSVAVELARRKVRVNVVSPGVVRTPQSEAYLAGMTGEQRAAIESAHPLGVGEPEDVAAAIAFLLSPDARWVTGENLVVDGGVSL